MFEPDQRTQLTLVQKCGDQVWSAWLGEKFLVKAVEMGGTWTVQSEVGRDNFVVVASFGQHEVSDEAVVFHAAILDGRWLRVLHGHGAADLEVKVSE